MLPAAFIEHQLPHRLRLKIPSKRGDGAFFEALARRSSMLPGVTALSANPLTASIVIHHAGDSKAITAVMVQEGLLDVCPEPKSSVHAGDAQGATGADPYQATAAGLFGLSVFQALRGELTGSASENLWNAYRAHTHLDHPWLTALLVGLGIYQLANGELLNSATALMFYAVTAQKLSQERSEQGALGQGHVPARLPTDPRAEVEQLTPKEL